MKLIEADKVKRVVKDYWKSQVDKAFTLTGVDEAIKRINSCLKHNHNLLKAIDELPLVQPEPRTAYWTKDIVGTVVCSKCGGIIRDNRIGHTQWCNSCGCFMRGQNDPETY